MAQDMEAYRREQMRRPGVRRVDVRRVPLKPEKPAAKPAGVATVRIGNYRADVDTTGASDILAPEPTSADRLRDLFNKKGFKPSSPSHVGTR